MIPHLLLSSLLTALAPQGLEADTAAVAPTGHDAARPPQALPWQGVDIVEVQANTFEGNRQQDPALAADADGRVLVAWGSRRQELGSFGVFAQLLDPLGRPLTPELHVNEFLPGFQGKPAVAFLADGTAWIAWNSAGQDGHGGGIWARRFGWREEVGEDGARRRVFGPLGPEIRIHQEPWGDQYDVAVAADGHGETVLFAWTSVVPLADAADPALSPDELPTRRLTLARRFDAGGAPLGDEFVVDGSDEYGDERLPTLAPHPEGWVVVWARIARDGTPEGIAGALLARDSDVPLASFEVADGSEALDIEPSVSSADDGSFVVAWMASEDGVDYVATARRFDADAEPLGAAFAVDAGGEGYRSGAQVAVAPDGSFTVAYTVVAAKVGREVAHRPRIEADVRARHFAADGAPVGEGFRLNAFADGQQTLQVGVNATHFAWTRRGQLVAAWHGNTAQGDHRGLGVTMVVPEGLTAPAPPPVERVAAAQDLTLESVYGNDQQAPPQWAPWLATGPAGPPPPPMAGVGGFVAHDFTGWTPPDPNIAVGPNHVVTVCNNEIAFFDKFGNNSFRQIISGSSGFWGSVGAGGFVFDPLAVFDPHSGRFIVAAADGAGNNDAVLIAVSDDDDPNGTWYKYRHVVAGTCDFLDFPNLGISSTAIFITGDCFYGGGNRAFVWDKAEVLNGLPATLRNIQMSSNLQSLGALKNYDDDLGYFATTYNSSSTQLKLMAIMNAPTNPTRTQTFVTVPYYTYPNDAVQLGTSNRADTIDFRIKSGVVRNGRMWVTHNNGANGRASVRWYEIDLQGWPNSGNQPVLVQSGDIEPSNIDYTWYGDIDVADDGTAVIAFNRSSSQQYISIEHVWRRAGDPLGTMRAPEQLQISTSPETGNRWGDYSGVQQDPVNPNRFWSHLEFRQSSWRTWAAEMEVGGQVLSLIYSGFVAGSTVTFTVGQAQPNETVIFYGSLTPGTVCPPELGGLCLDLGGTYRTLGTDVADAFGVATLSKFLPARFAGQTAYVQAAAQRGVNNVDSVKSNLVSDVIQ